MISLHVGGGGWEGGIQCSINVLQVFSVGGGYSTGSAFSIKCCDYCLLASSILAAYVRL